MDIVQDLQEKTDGNINGAKLAEFVYHTGEALRRGLAVHSSNLEKDIRSIKDEVIQADFFELRKDFIGKVLANLWLTLSDFSYRYTEKEPPFSFNYVPIKEVLELIFHIEEQEKIYIKAVNNFIDQLDRRLVPLYNDNPFLIKTACYKLSPGYRPFLDLLSKSWDEMDGVQTNALLANQ